MVITLDTPNRRALLSLRQSEILEELQSVTLDLANLSSSSTTSSASSSTAAAELKNATLTVIPTFHPEYGRYMLESTPGAPYGGGLKDLVGVEGNMKFR